MYVLSPFWTFDTFFWWEWKSVNSFAFDYYFDVLLGSNNDPLYLAANIYHWISVPTSSPSLAVPLLFLIDWSSLFYFSRFSSLLSLTITVFYIIITMFQISITTLLSFLLLFAYTNHACLSPTQLDGLCTACPNNHKLMHGFCLPHIPGCMNQISPHLCSQCSQGYTLANNFCSPPSSNSAVIDQ